MSLTPYSPWRFLELARQRTSIDEKINALQSLLRFYPRDAASGTARTQLVTLLEGDNRYQEALQIYETHSQAEAPPALDFKLLDYELKLGNYSELLRAGMQASGNRRDLARDERLVELQVQALLGKGRYTTAREKVDHWLALYAGVETKGSRYENDVRALHFLAHQLRVLERAHGAVGKPLFTSAMPDRSQQWNQRNDIPLVFFKLLPGHSAGQLPEALLPGSLETDADFETRVDEVNKGFHYLSGGAFSLSYAGLRTLTVNEGDVDPLSSGGHLLTSRVYLHTIPELYRLAGQAFVVLVDYRAQASEEAAYLGDGMVHISAAKLKTLVLMHEILHGLGATHQDWRTLEGLGYQFDAEDRGLMTFERGEILNLGLEEKNRVLLGWPHVAVLHFSDGTSLTAHSEPRAEPMPQLADTSGLGLPEGSTPLAAALAPEQARVALTEDDLSRLPI